ncbi:MULTISPECIES: PASTA domain-containing protein [unclassified Nocardioides]|uniref:PASTA domain-containing protein n=1 Tax=unclassified Nocardioides TaxID=2615069 RepID=UPI000700B8AA|nr:MULTISPECIES: PASTA domain-containing protein [unclassified Nocardioides]KRA38745.1 hypothetical protein ASD81_09115 [Nocardioides sp. Root614]KRA92705.1 hypothetical protein ASD84_09380 [Nocardioides sp. Root682]
MPTDDVTEQQARDLLARAAATITLIEPAALTLTGLPEPRRRRVRGLLGVAAAVALIAGAAVVVERLVDEPSPAVTGEPVERPHTYPADQVPSYLGFDRDAAVADLESRGLRAKVVEEPDGCQPSGVVWGSMPPAGAVVEPGDTVVVRVYAAQQVIDCDSPGFLGWSMVRFARGLDEAPEFADSVTLTTPGGASRKVAGSALRDRRSPLWVVCDAGECHSAIAALEELVTTPFTSGGHPVSPYVRLDALSQLCRKKSSSDLALTVEVNTDGVGICPRKAVWLTFDGDGHISGLELSIPVEDPPAEAVEPPKPTEPRRESAEQFVAWARGTGGAPDFADSVRNLGPGFVGDPNTEPESREYWSGCSGLGFPDCGIDPIASLLHDPSEIVALAGRLQCPWSEEPNPDPIAGEPIGLPARFLTPGAEADAVRLQPVGAAGCAEGTLINLWIHPDGEIYAVALVLPVTPPAP